MSLKNFSSPQTEGHLLGLESGFPLPSPTRFQTYLWFVRAIIMPIL